MIQRSFCRSIRDLVRDPIGQAFVGAADPEVLTLVARHLALSDPYGERMRLESALALVGDGRLEGLLEHQLWCATRDARWLCGELDAAKVAASVDVEGERWMVETCGHPTVLIAPMTVSMRDAAATIAFAVARFAPGRPLAIYGEDVDADDLAQAGLARYVAGSGAAAVRRILRTLQTAGLLATYPDFVYEGHPILPVSLFQRSRPMSAGFVALAARAETMLLPALITREGQRLKLRFFEPVTVEWSEDEEPGARERNGKHLVAQIVAYLLESLIRQMPEQWLLLPTLTFDSPQFATGVAGDAAGSLLHR